MPEKAEVPVNPFDNRGYWMNLEAYADFQDFRRRHNSFWKDTSKDTRRAFSDRAKEQMEREFGKPQADVPPEPSKEEVPEPPAAAPWPPPGFDPSKREEPAEAEDKKPEEEKAPWE